MVFLAHRYLQSSVSKESNFKHPIFPFLNFIGCIIFVFCTVKSQFFVKNQIDINSGKLVMKTPILKRILVIKSTFEQDSSLVPSTFHRSKSFIQTSVQHYWISILSVNHLIELALQQKCIKIMYNFLIFVNELCS